MLSRRPIRIRHRLKPGRATAVPAEPPARKALPPAPIDNSQPPDEPRPSGPSGFWIAGAIVVVVVLLGMCSTKRDQAPAPAPTQSTTENVSDTEDMIEITNASDGPAAVTAEEVANSVVRYIAADTNGVPKPLPPVD
ncbi:MAG: hypothetical protein WDN24_17125 [Sphingomonas sp.]